MKKNTKKQSKSTLGLLDNIVKIIIVLAVLLLLAILVTFRAEFKIWHLHGSAMAPTYVNGSSLLATRSDKDYKVGDVVVMDSPDPSQGHFPITILRIAAVGGDKVVISNGNFDIYNSTHPSGYDPDSSYLSSKPKTNGNVNEVIPTNDVYVLGDNRSDSLDSRTFGVVDSKTILGKVIYKL
jgi:signal peptidase I